jgi:hypothetical protein
MPVGPSGSRPTCRESRGTALCDEQVTYLVVCGEVGRCYTACRDHAVELMRSGEADCIVPLDSLPGVEWRGNSTPV